MVTMWTSKHVPKSNMGEHIFVSQERFLIDPSLDKQKRKDEIGELRWYIPLTYMTENSDKERMLWINRTSRK